MSILPHQVVYGRNVYVAPTAYVGGDVVIGDDCTIMHHVTIRGDVAPIRLGNRVNIQDGCVLHCNRNVTLELGDEVAVGHRAVVHCHRIGAGSLIGTGALLLDDAAWWPLALCWPRDRSCRTAWWRWESPLESSGRSGSRTEPTMPGLYRGT